jgi:hypothetical protein
MIFKEKQIPAFVGMTEYKYMDSCMRRNDILFLSHLSSKGVWGFQDFKEYMDSSLRSE